MRGAISGGMGAGLEHLDLLNTFDAVYGASSGAFNAVFFVAKQAVYATSVYYEFLNNRRFINFRRFFSREPIVSLNHVLEHVIVKEKILDWRTVLESAIPFKVVASSVDKLKSQILSDFTTKDSLFAALHASSNMPLVAGPPFQLDGDRFVDASLFEAIPLQSAINDGCTHLLVLLTRPNGRLKKASVLDRVVATRLNKIRSGLGSCYLESNNSYNDTVRLIQEAHRSFQGPPYIFSVSLPRGYHEIRRMERRRNVILQATKDGMRAALEVFVPEELVMVETLIPVDSSGHICKVSWQFKEVLKDRGESHSPE